MARTHHDPEALREALRNADKSQIMLAIEVGCSPSLVSEWLAGTRSAGPERLRSLAKVLSCSVADLEARQPNKGAA